MNNFQKYWLLIKNKVIGIIELDFNSNSIYTNIFYSGGSIKKFSFNSNTITIYGGNKSDIITYQFTKNDGKLYYNGLNSNKENCLLVPVVKNTVDKLNLDDTTLICLDGMNPKRSIRSMEICKEYCNFSDVKLLSSVECDYKHSVKVDKVINSKNKYSEFICKDVYKYCKTKYMLIVQYDGWVCNPAAWKPEWYNYDYIGADISHFSKGYKFGGNGGFSFRSCKLMKEVSMIFSDKHLNMAEDKVICIDMVDHLMHNGFKFSNDCDFSVDHKLWTHQLGFHKCDNRLWINPFT